MAYDGIRPSDLPVTDESGDPATRAEGVLTAPGVKPVPSTPKTVLRRVTGNRRTTAVNTRWIISSSRRRKNRYTVV